ncbi:MAG: Gfo/Idh/MocA family protein [Bryobacteraceae bacterium]
MPEKPLRVAVVGLGFMGGMHISALQSIPGAELVAVYSRDERKLSGDLSDVGGNVIGAGGVYDFSSLKRYRDLEGILNDPEIDALDICLPTNLHADVTVAALVAGKDVLVEKPMALDLDSSLRMSEASRSASRILMVAHVLRFLPVYQVLLDAVASGSYGSVRGAIFRRRCAAPSWSGWLGDPAKSGGGVFDLLIHDVDMCLHLFGRPESVSAIGYESLSDSIDIISGRLHYPNNLAIEIAGGWHHPKTFPFTMEYTVVMDEGTIDFRHETRPPTLYARSGDETALTLGTRDGYAAEIEYFVQCCQTRQQPTLCPPAESAQAVGLMKLLLQSRRENGSTIACKL